MKYKALLLDLDGTIYPYESTHAQALKLTYENSKSFVEWSEIEFYHLYHEARVQINSELNGRSASHNRLLYFQRIAENYPKVPLEKAITLYYNYWNNFCQSIAVYQGVMAVFEQYKKNICILTDLTADVQHRKLNKLGLMPYLHSIVTSEEAGTEKPSPLMFSLALKKLKLDAKDVCMIGDSYEKDIVGANNCGIFGYWFSTQNKISKAENNITFNNYYDLCKLIN